MEHLGKCDRFVKQLEVAWGIQSRRRRDDDDYEEEDGKE